MKDYNEFPVAIGDHHHQFGGDKFKSPPPPPPSQFHLQVISTNAFVYESENGIFRIKLTNLKQFPDLFQQLITSCNLISSSMSSNHNIAFYLISARTGKVELMTCDRFVGTIHNHCWIFKSPNQPFTVYIMDDRHQ